MAFGKVFSRRCVICYFLLCVLLLFCCLRLSTVATGDYATVYQSQNYRRLTVAATRGTIYDRNGMPLTNRTALTYAAVAPTDENIEILRAELSAETFAAVKETLSAGLPTVVPLKTAVRAVGITCVRVPAAHAADQPALHLIGTCDNDGNGLSGLEAAYNNLLCGEPVEAVFGVDGRGRALSGETITFLENATPNALYTTLDLPIQRTTEKATVDMPCGAALLCDLDGHLLAAVSRPDYDCTHLADTLNETDSPHLNRVLTAYSVGSIFKPCVAAAGLENGVLDKTFSCNGKTAIGGRDFHCHRADGHGTLSLSGAIQNSCNIYFYQYAKAVGAKSIRRMAQSLEFGSAIRLGDAFFSARGHLPDQRELVGDAALFNLGIGQGTLSLPPLALCTLYSAIARDGTYILPHVVTAAVQNGIKTEYPSPAPTRVMTVENAKILRKSLEKVVSVGTGTAAKAKTCTVAGKTATAQTGRFQNGKEITIGWFCGFFPAENPRYVGVVCMENANGSDAAAVFAQIVDALPQAAKE